MKRKPQCACQCHELSSKRATRVVQLAPLRSNSHSTSWCAEYTRLGQIVRDNTWPRAEPRVTQFHRLDGWKESR